METQTWWSTISFQAVAGECIIEVAPKTSQLQQNQQVDSRSGPHCSLFRSNESPRYTTKWGEKKVVIERVYLSTGDREAGHVRTLAKAKIAQIHDERFPLPSSCETESLDEQKEKFFR